MIIKGRSPTMRHVSRTHGVALDWLFDRVNSDPKIKIKYVDTKNQLADALTKGSFSRDEWNHLLRLFNIVSFSMCSCSHFSDLLSDDQVRKQSAMSKKRSEDDFKRRLSDGESETMLGGAWLEEWRNLFTKFGISGQSGEYRWKKRRRTRIQETGATRLKFRSRIFSSESTRECSTSIQETGAGRINSKHTVMRENILTPIAQGDFLRQHRIEKHGIHEPSIHEQDLSLSAKEMGMSTNDATF